MSILSDFFIATPDSFLEYGSTEDFPAEDRCQFKYITPLEAAGISAVLRGEDDPIDLLDEFPLLSPEDAEDWTMGVPADMTKSLAELTDSQVPDVAQCCADMTAEELGWSAADFQDILIQLRALSQRAVDTKKSMYLWNSL